MYDGLTLALPAQYYEDTLICYSYSKSLSLPGERIGYIMVIPKAHSRKLIYSMITDCGFEAIRPDGAFYLFVKAPSGDGNEFSERAKKYELLIVPSDSFGMEGYVRISYCVSKKQIEASASAFRALAQSYGLQK